MTNGIRAIRTLRQLRAQVAAWRAAGETIALVPTMGALHEGHLALVRLGRQRCRRVVVSIFVNPTQFAPHEDFERYPRDEAGDLAKLAGVGCDAAWMPDRGLMYPDGFATRIVPEGAAAGLESDTRPHFFGGVATVCCKLFGQVAPDVAVFGEKDYQQLCVIRQTVRDLDLPLEIVGAPTVRDADGLALSSRNAYLTPAPHRTRAQPCDHKSCSGRPHRRRSRRGCSAGTRRHRARRLLACGLCRGARCRHPGASNCWRRTFPARAGGRVARQDAADRQRRRLRPHSYGRRHLGHVSARREAVKAPQHQARVHRRAQR